MGKAKTRLYDFRRLDRTTEYSIWMHAIRLGFYLKFTYLFTYWI